MNKFQGRRYVKRLRLLALAAIGLILCIHVIRPHTFVDDATRVADTTDWASVVVPDGSAILYKWLSNDEVLYGRREDNARIRLVRTSLGREVKSDLPVTVPVASVEWELSPDLQQFHWIELSGRGAGFQATRRIVSLDGTSGKPLPRSWDYTNPFVWTSDGSNVLWTESKSIVRSFGLRTGKSRAWPLLPPRFPRDPGEPGPFQGPMIPMKHYADGSLLTTRYSTYFVAPSFKTQLSTENRTRFCFAKYNLNRPEAQPETWEVSAPANTDAGCILLSPKGDRLLWVTSDWSVAPLEKLLTRVLPGFKAHARRTVRYLVSDIRGVGMHEIGACPGRPMRTNDIFAADDIYPQWTPDGKRISFVVRGGLYVFPVH